MYWRNYIEGICDDIDTAIEIIGREKEDCLSNLFDDYWDEITETLHDVKDKLEELVEF